MTTGLVTGGKEVTGSPPAQPGEDCGGGEAVGNEANRRLEIPHRGPCFRAEAAIRLASVEALLVQKLLKLAAFVARQHRLVPRPSLREGFAAAEAVGQMS